MRRLFLTTFLWFWFTLVGLGLAVTLLFLRYGITHGMMWHFVIHDFLIFSLAGAIFCYIVSSYLTKPLHCLAVAAASIAAGHLDTRAGRTLAKRRDEIGDLAGVFNLMAERIEALVTGQRRLLGDVSHELRSPLARLVVALSLVKQGPPEEAADNLERIRVEASRLDALIGQLLTLTRIDTGADRESPRRFDLANLVQEIASDADFEARARNRRAIVTHADECIIEGYEELLRSAVENVVRNAVRHTREKTVVEISLECRGGQALLRVRDYGPGVPESMLAGIFQPFRRVSNGGEEGAGLGLAIAERAVHVHRGTILALNAPHPGGLVVEIVLPHV